MRYLLACLIVCLLFPDILHAGNRRFLTPAPVVAACANTICLALMDFEGAGCTHGNPQSPDGEETTCTIGGGANADCSTSPCPLEGTLSGQSTDTQSFNVTNLTPITTGVITLEFVWHPPADPGSQDNLIEFFDGTQRTCRVQWRTGGQLRALANGGQATTQWDSTPGNSYWIRVTYDVGLDDCRLIIHDWDGANIGANLHDATVDGNSPPSQVVGWRSVNGATQTINLDSVYLCSGDLGAVTTTRCGD